MIKKITVILLLFTIFFSSPMLSAERHKYNVVKSIETEVPVHSLVTDWNKNSNSIYEKNNPQTCEEKLKFLEPSKPKTIYDYELLPDRNLDAFKTKTFPISWIKKNGALIPFVTVYKNLNWKRPAYDPAWHSSSWRWSYVPRNMAYQQHILYNYQGGLSWWYDLSHDLALPSNLDTTSPIHEFAFTIKYPYIIRFIIFKTNVTSIQYYKNQLLISGEPLRKGLTIIDLDARNLPNSKKLVQLATPDGYELDYLIVQF